MAQPPPEPPKSPLGTPPDPQATRGGVIGAGIFTIILLGMAWKIFKPAEVMTAKDIPPAPATDPSAAANAEAILAAQALRAYYPMTYRSAEGFDKFATCHDETKGFDKLLACLATATAMANQERLALPATAKYPVGCAHEIETKSRALIAGMPVFLGDYVEWLKANEKKLKPAMATRTVSDACDVTKVKCEEAPDQLIGQKQAYKDASFANINQIECVKTVFQCGPPDNVCWVGKVVGRLGIDPDPSVEKPTSHPNDILRVRATGSIVSPFSR